MAFKRYHTIWQHTLGLITTGARGSITSFTFLLAAVAVTGAGAPGEDVAVVAGDVLRSAVGELRAGTGEPPIKSETSLWTSSLSLESGSGDFVRLGVAP